MLKKAVILAGGRGTRFLPYTKACAKEMMPVVDKPVLQYIVEECAAAGLTDILIVGRPDKPEIKRHFSKDENLLAFLEKNGKYDLEKTVSDICGEAEITVIDQLDAGGSGAAVMLAKDFAGGEPFAILNGDDLYYSLSKRPAIGQVADCYLKFGRTSLGVLEVAREDVSKYCSLKLDGEKDGYFVCSDVVEKPAPEAAPSNVATLGRYVVDENFFSYLERSPKSKNGEVFLTDAFGLQAREEKVYACPLNVVRYDTGDKLGYEKANVEFALRNETIGKEFAAYLKEISKSI